MLISEMWLVELLAWCDAANDRNGFGTWPSLQLGGGLIHRSAGFPTPEPPAQETSITIAVPVARMRAAGMNGKEVDGIWTYSSGPCAKCSGAKIFKLEG